MAQTKSTPAKTGMDNKPATVEPAKKAVETSYSAADLTTAARARFNVPPEVVKAALKQAGKTKATLTEAKSIIKCFMERKVT